MDDTTAIDYLVSAKAFYAPHRVDPKAAGEAYDYAIQAIETLTKLRENMANATTLAEFVESLYAVTESAEQNCRVADVAGALRAAEPTDDEREYCEKAVYAAPTGMIPKVTWLIAQRTLARAPLEAEIERLKVAHRELLQAGCLAAECLAEVRTGSDFEVECHEAGRDLRELLKGLDR